MNKTLKKILLASLLSTIVQVQTFAYQNSDIFNSMVDMKIEYESLVAALKGKIDSTSVAESADSQTSAISKSFLFGLTKSDFTSFYNIYNELINFSGQINNRENVVAQYDAAISNLLELYFMKGVDAFLTSFRQNVREDSDIVKMINDSRITFHQLRDKYKEILMNDIFKPSLD